MRRQAAWNLNAPEENSMATVLNSTSSSDRSDSDVQTLRLPYATEPTNLPGVYSIVAFTSPDLRTASATELVRQGFLIPQPKADAPASVVHAWNRALSQPWTPENHVVPVLKPHPGRTHLRTPGARRRPRVEEDTSSNWSGVELGNGPWSSVSAFWTVPTVSKPTEHSGPGGWESGSWVGLGGDLAFNSTDLLQAGISQNVNTSGHASYYAWYEWIDYFCRYTSGEQTPSTFGMASLGEMVFIAFRGEQNHLDIIYSTNNGNSFGNKLTSNETTPEGPALVMNGATLIVAWTGVHNNCINVAQVDYSGTTPKLTNQVTLPWTSTSGPALASLNGTVYLAWKGSDNFITLASSTDNGATFSAPFQSRETTSNSPSLATELDFVKGSTLLMAWKGEKDDSLNVASVSTANNVPTGIVNPIVVPSEATSQNPAIGVMSNVVFLAWKDSKDDHLSVMQSTDNGQSFFNKVTSSERSPSGPTLCNMFDVKVLVGWRGEEDHVDLAPVGLRNGSIPGFGEDPSYFQETEISNFPVHAGDSIVCTVLYALGLGSGSIYMGNMTTEKHFEITIVPPFQAEMDGGCVEWIMEAPQYENKQTVIPKFTPVNFTDALSCSFSGQVGNPINGQTIDLVNAGGDPVTEVSSASDSVTIDFDG
jgi:hypothetical protein